MTEDFAGSFKGSLIDLEGAGTEPGTPAAVEAAPLGWWAQFGCVMAFNTLVYLLALCKDDLSIVDISWGIMFIIPNAAIAYHRVAVLEQEVNDVMILTIVLIAVWGVRLSWHIGSRHKGEDYRYKIIKARWKDCILPIRLLCSYLYIFALQGLFAMVVNASALHITANSKEKSVLGVWEITGASVWLVGFLYEVISDSQL